VNGKTLDKVDGVVGGTLNFPLFARTSLNVNINVFIVAIQSTAGRKT